MKSKKLEKELKLVPAELHDLFRVVRQMNTFVCESCFNEELRTHPKLGDEWNFDWFVEMAKLAKDNGWKTFPPPKNRESWFFEDLHLLCPKCAPEDK